MHQDFHSEIINAQRKKNLKVSLSLPSFTFICVNNLNISYTGGIHFQFLWLCVTIHFSLCKKPFKTIHMFSRLWPTFKSTWALRSCLCPLRCDLFANVYISCHASCTDMGWLVSSCRSAEVLLWCQASVTAEIFFTQWTKILHLFAILTSINVIWTHIRLFPVQMIKMENRIN